MASNPSKLLLKEPVQARSKILVGAVLSGAKQCLEISESSAATVRRIADVAGVGISSIYEYFSNKSEIFKALLAQQIQIHLNLAFKHFDHADFQTEYKKMIGDLFDDLYSRRDFTANLIVALPPSFTKSLLLRSRLSAMEILKSHILPARPDLDEAELNSRALFFVNCFMDSIHNVAYAKREKIDLDIEKVKTHLSSLAEMLFINKK